jgi:hypothetical protein
VLLWFSEMGSGEFYGIKCYEARFFSVEMAVAGVFVA